MTTQMISVAEFDAIIDQIVNALNPVYQRTELYAYALKTTPPTLHSSSIFPKRAGAPRGIGRTSIPLVIKRS